MPLWAAQRGDMKKGDYDKDGDGIVDLPLDELTALLATAKEEAKAEIRAELAQAAPASADAVIQAYLNARKARG